MRKKVLILFLLVASISSLQAQSQKQYPTFLEKNSVPDGLHYLPAPPDTATAAFMADAEAYEKGKSIRNTPRGKMAADDADTSTEKIIAMLAAATNQIYTQKDCPNLYYLIERTMNDAYQSISSVKKHYKRIRPFVLFNEPSGIPEEEESHRKTFSYPSAHSAMAWAAALVMVEILPCCQEEILQRGYEFGQSRVIAGYHYQSDVDAARLAASATVARLHADKKFRKVLKKAKKEVRFCR